MKITKEQLKQIIKEELSKVLNETQLDAIPELEDTTTPAKKIVARLENQRPEYMKLMKDTYIYQLNSARKMGGETAKKAGDVIVGFSNEMGALYVSKKGGKSVELFSADVEKIIKTYKKFKRKLD